jgi:hypothetical protein
MCAVRMEKIEETLRLALAFAQRFNARDQATLGELFHPDCVFEAAGPAPEGARQVGKAAVTAAIGDFFKTFPELAMEVEEAFGMGRHAVLRWRLSGIPGVPGGKRGVDIFASREGLITEIYAYAKG